MEFIKKSKKTITYLNKYLHKLEETKPIKCSDLNKKNDLPETKGVYVFFDRKKTVVYVGICGVHGKKSTFRSRIWRNHFTGNYKSSTLQRKIIKQGIRTTKKIKCHIKNNFSLKYIEIKDEKRTVQVEHFLIAVLKPKYND